jgi:tetratricopeptide (TPR) repeat protein
MSRRKGKQHVPPRGARPLGGSGRGQARPRVRLSDPSGRGLPPASERKHVVDRIRSIPEDARTPDDWYVLGSLLVYDACLEDADDLLNEGSEALTRAADSDPPVPEAIIDLVWLLNLRGLPALALSYAKRATDSLPENRDAWRFRANTHMQLKQKEQAIESLKRAVALPTSIPADRETLVKWESGDCDGGRGVLMFGAMSGDVALDSTLETHEEAIKLSLFYSKQLLQLLPEDSDALYAAALGHYKLKDYPQAERRLAQLFHAAENHADGLCMQALIKSKQGDEVSAEKFYEKALKASPDHVLANSNLAKILLDEHGNAREAQVLLERALQANPKYAPALSMYGNTIAQLDGDFKREAEYHAKAIQYGPVHPAFRFCYLMSLLQAGDFYRLRKEWRRHSPYLVNLSADKAGAAPVEMLNFIVPKVLDPPGDFGVCVMIAEQWRHTLGGVALAPLLKSAWQHRHTIDDENMRLASYGWLGMVAGHCQQHELALEVFRASDVLEGKRGEASLNVAVTLGRMGRYDEAIELARSVEPGTQRALTIEANLLGGAGKKADALQAFLRAAEVEKDFSLPVTNGMELAIAMGDLGAIERFASLARTRFGGTPEGQYTYAKGRLALGFPGEAADVLIGLLYEDGVPRGLKDASQDAHRDENEAVDGESSTEELDIEDLSVFGGQDEGAMFFTLAHSFLKARRFGQLIQLGDWMQEHRSIHGDWMVLVAEANRHIGAHQKAIEILDGMQLQPPPQATRALIAAADGDWTTVRDAANIILSRQFQGQAFFHPEGKPDAVAYAVRAVNMVAEGYPTEAIAESLNALSQDPSCGIAYVALANAYDGVGDVEKATEAALQGLEHVPGDSGILSWLIVKLIDLGRAVEADEVLGCHREQLASRGVAEVGHWLGERVARARMTVTTRPPEDLNAAWVSQLEPPSRDWLSAAVAGNDKVSDLRLGIAIYYCKIVEQELASKLIRPFVESRPRSNPAEYEGDLRDIQRCLDDGRMPGLGSVAHALRVAFRPARAGDSTLLASWRSYLRNLPDPTRSAVRTPEFTDIVRMLADVRNRVAHLGDLTHDEFVRVENAVLAGRNPGLVLRVLGIG